MELHISKNCSPVEAKVCLKKNVARFCVLLADAETVNDAYTTLTVHRRNMKISSKQPQTESVRWFLFATTTTTTISTTTSKMIMIMILKTTTTITIEAMVMITLIITVKMDRIYFLVFVLITLTSLVYMDRIQRKCCFRARPVGLISTKTKE